MFEKLKNLFSKKEEPKQEAPKEKKPAKEKKQPELSAKDKIGRAHV